MVYKNVHIPLTVLRHENLGADCLSVYFERPIGFIYEAGDWISMEFADTSLKGGKVYSLSSSPSENELAITFRRGITPFKRRLQSVKKNEKIYINHYGNDYNFYLKKNRSSVLIAGGIGIAPFRSMLKEMVDTSSSNMIQLFYLNKGDHYLFYKEIEQWSKVLNLEVHYINTNTVKRKERQKAFEKNLRFDYRYYFIAGPEGMVENTEHFLIEKGIDIKHIRIDNFGNY